jgi:hypothetical protein
MHWRHRSRIGPSAFAAMGHIDTGKDALGVFEARADGSIVEIVCPTGSAPRPVDQG